MRVFNKDKTIELKEYDLDRGFLVDDEIEVAHEAEIVHHEAIAHVEEQGHYEVIKEYPNGGKDVKWVVDVPYVEGNEAYDEEVKPAYTSLEQIKVYIPYPESYWEEKRKNEENLKRIEEEKRKEEERLLQEQKDFESGKTVLLKELSDIRDWFFEHDYIGIKIATKRASLEDYEDIVAEMETKAKRLNEVKNKLQEIENSLV